NPRRSRSDCSTAPSTAASSATPCAPAWCPGSPPPAWRRRPRSSMSFSVMTWPLEQRPAVGEGGRVVARDASAAAAVAPPPAEPPVAALVVAERAGDRAAFAALYHRFARVVHAVALARVRVADAADVVQDVFLTAYERLGELREPAAFPGWLLQIARNR